MIQRGTYLNTADNSGAKLVQCIGIPGGAKKMHATVGDVITVTVKSAIPNGTAKKGKVYKKVKEEELVEELMKEIEKLLEEDS